MREIAAERCARVIASLRFSRLGGLCDWLSWELLATRRQPIYGEEQWSKSLLVSDRDFASNFAGDRRHLATRFGGRRGSPPCAGSATACCERDPRHLTMRVTERYAAVVPELHDAAAAAMDRAFGISIP